MNCKKCGSPLVEGDLFCKNCGAAVNAQDNTEQPSVVQIEDNNETQKPMTQPEINNMNNNMNNNNTNMNMSNQTPAPKKDSGIVKYILIGIGVVIVALLAVILLRGNGTQNTNTQNTDNNTEVAKKETSSYKVTFKGFVFSIPDNLIYETKTDALAIGDEKGTWMSVIEIEQGSFEKIKENKSQLQSVMQQSGYTASEAVEKTIGGIEFITMELTSSGQKAVAALTKANSMYFMGVTVLNLDNEFDYSLLETIAPIIASAEYKEQTTNMKNDTELDMSKIAKIAK